MPHHLTSFISALIGYTGSGTCCGCIPFTFSPAAAPAIASSTIPLSASLPNTVIPAAVASQSATSSTPVLTSIMAAFAPFLTFYKNSNNFDESKECSRTEEYAKTKETNKTKYDKTCQCNLIYTTDQNTYTIETEPNNQNKKQKLANNAIDENRTSLNTIKKHIHVNN